MMMDSLLAAFEEPLIGRLKLQTPNAVRAALGAQKSWRDRMMADHPAALKLVAETYGAEAVRRADIIREQLLQSRLAWSPKQIVDHADVIRLRVTDVLKATVSEVGGAIDEDASINEMRRTSGKVAASGYDVLIAEASRTALKIVDSCVSEVIAGAQADLEGKTMADKSTFHNHFHGNVGAVAQGGGSIGSVQQTNKGLSPEDLAAAIETILGALSEYGGGDEKVVSAIEDLKVSLATAKRGHLPVMDLLTGAIKTLRGAEQLVVHAPAAVDALHHLGNLSP